MKIRSINRTIGFKHIEFGIIKDRWQSSYVYTPSGFKRIKAFECIKRNAPTKILKLTNNMALVCDPEHRVATNHGDKFVKDLRGDDLIFGINGYVRILGLADGPPSDLYDIEIDAPHWYYTAGILSHNSIMLVNNAIANVLHKRNVLYITLELSDVMSALRAMGVLTGKPILSNRFAFKDDVLAYIHRLKSSGEVGTLAFHEFPPDETSVDQIYSLIDHLRRSRGWQPDIVCIDYLELMTSRRASDNKDEYLRQKSISTQVRGLAIKENVLVFTATQTNRSGNNGEQNIDISKIAESYGKSMPMDYLISLNQTQEEYDSQFDDRNGIKESVRPAPARMYIAKNRHGSKFVSIPVEINYKTMGIKATL